VYCTDCNPASQRISVFNGIDWFKIDGTPVLASDEVYNPVTGRIWKDRNLGASQVATSSTDAAAYGDLYQWGRATEGHESRTSVIISGLATTEVPNGGNSWDGKFITDTYDPSFDWLTPQDGTLWQGVNGTNNPCPAGFRLPTEAEWEAERLSWSSIDAAGAFGSPLKLTLAGWRNGGDGVLLEAEEKGQYWSSSVSGYLAYLLYFDSEYAYITDNNDRISGNCVRCIKE